MAVFVLDRNKKSLMPCSEKRARLLLEKGRAIVYKIEPFTIRLKNRTVQKSELQPLRLKFDPGAKTTGFAVTRDEENAIILGELFHKIDIKSSLKSRRDSRRNRRNRKTRYRKCRFENRKTKLRDCKNCGGNTPKRRNKKGNSLGGRESLCTPCRLKLKEPDKLLERTKRLAPSLVARVNQTINMAKKILKLCPIKNISMELVKFDAQLLMDKTIKGVEYQQGTLLGYTVREYLLEKWGRKCCYCAKKDVALEIEHVTPRSRGGSDKISNLALACNTCNQEKGNLLFDEWEEKLSKKKSLRAKTIILNISEVKKQLTVSLKDAAMMNATRWKLFEELKKLNLPLETGTGALTKMQRIAHGLIKEHYFDALCVGLSTPEEIYLRTKYVCVWTAKGRGDRQMVRVDKYGFPYHHLDKEKYDKNGKRKGHKERAKSCFGFSTGDIVKADVTEGKKKGNYRGRVAIRHTGYFDIEDIYTQKIIQGISYKFCKILQKNDGWSYRIKEYKFE